MAKFKAILIEKADSGQKVGLVDFDEAQLMEGDVTGRVERSNHKEFKPGDAVVLNGFGLGETHLGGYAEKTRVKGEWLVPLPKGISAKEAMEIGTAGYTAMLAVMA